MEFPGTAPDETLDQDETLRREISVVGDAGERRFEPDVSPAAQLFRESVFVLCKSVRILCEAARQADDGLPTWSISTAHQGALFALRGFLGLCGIAYLEINNKCYLMDVKPGEPKGRRSRRPTIHHYTPEVQVINVPQMKHSDWWRVYQRIINTSSETFDDCWRYPIDMELGNCKNSVFSRHRNDLHYRLKWFYGDLLENSVVESFGWFSEDSANALARKLNEDGGSDGMIILNQVLLGNSLAMLEDMARSSRRVKDIVDEMDGAIQKFSNDIIVSWYPK